MYAIVETGGKQYRVSNNETINVDLITDAEGELLANGEEVVLDRVLMVANEDGSYAIGAPLVEKAIVHAKIVHGIEKGEKVIVFKKKRRQGYKKTIGHRQQHTKLLITSISS